MIRLAHGRQDLDAVERIERESFRPDQRWDFDDLLFYSKLNRLIVHEEPAGAIIGYAAFRITGYIGHIDSVAVALQAQGVGIGRNLVLDAIRRMSGVECVELECDSNLSGFYERLGFQVCGFYTTGVKLPRHRLHMRKW